MDYSTFDQLLTPVIVVNDHGKPVYFNHICSIFFKLAPRKLAKLTHINELIKNDQLDFENYLDTVLKNNAAETSPEITFDIEQIGETTVILKFIPFGKDVLINVLDFSIEKKIHEKYKRQVAELKDTHEQILKADKLTALGEMISGISHEVSTPLTIVNDRIEQLASAVYSQNLDRAKKVLTELSTEYQRIMKIISGMKSFVKNQEDDFVITDLNLIIDDTLKFIDELDFATEVTVRKEVESSHWVMANPLKLEQVLINLVKNSLDALKSAKTKNPEIVISLSEEKDSQVHYLIVRDNGPGIPQEDQNNIFEMFYTSKEVEEGTGLGLSITKKIVEAHSGEISLSQVDSGCEFQISLPIIELGSFTKTNKYLSGELEVEPNKILFIGDDIELLNEIYQEMKAKDFVLIFSNKIKSIENLADFLLVDQVVKLIDVECNFEYEKSYDLFSLSREEIINKIKELF